MDKMRMESVDMTAQNIEKIEALFPNCITETADADGKLRKLENPKRKKLKHIQATKYVFAEIKEKVMNEGYLLDADLRKALKEVTDVKA